MEETDYADFLWDKYVDLIRPRFVENLFGTKSLIVTKDKEMELHLQFGKAYEKLRLRTDDYGEMGRVFQKYMNHFTSISIEYQNLTKELKFIRDEFFKNRKKVKRSIEKEDKIHKTIFKNYDIWRDKVFAAKAKDATESKKWLDQVKKVEEVYKKQMKKKFKKTEGVEKKLRETCIKSRQQYFDAVQQLKEKKKEFWKENSKHLMDVRALDIRLIEHTKETLLKSSDVMIKFYEKMKEEAEKLKEEFQKIDSNEFVNIFVEKNKSKEIGVDEAEKYQPFVEDEHVLWGKVVQPRNLTLSIKNRVLAQKEYIPVKKKWEGYEKYLFFREGDKISVLEENKDGMWYGICKGREGLFPADRVEEVDGKGGSAFSSGKRVRRESIRIGSKGNNSGNDGTTPGGENENETEGEFEVVEFVTAEAKYEAQDNTELSFKVGEKIKVLMKNKDGWYFGKIGENREREGYFPVNFTSGYAKYQEEQENETAEIVEEQITEEDMKTEYDKLKDEKNCVICLEKAKSILFLPCKHLCTCEGCSQQVNICPICRGKIDDRIKTFM